MSLIKFTNSDYVFDIKINIRSNRAEIIFNNIDEIPSEDILLSGFVELNEHNNIVQSDFTDMKYIYRNVDDLTYILTNKENDIYVKPTYETEQYISTLEEIKNIKINFLSAVCKQNIIDGVNVEINGVIEHFSYKDEDQENIKELFDLVRETNVPMYYHHDNGGCKQYSVEQIITIYSIASTNKNHHTTYFNQLKQYIESLETKEDVEKVTYGTELTGKYLETYNASMLQAQIVLETLLAKMSINVPTEEKKTLEPELLESVININKNVYTEELSEENI